MVEGELGELGGGERRTEEVIATRLPATALKSPRFLCGRPFLLRLQARHPLIHELYEKCGELFNKVGSAINRPVKEPTCASEVASFNLDNEENLKPSWQAAYMDVLKETLQGGEEEALQGVQGRHPRAAGATW